MSSSDWEKKVNINNNNKKKVVQLRTVPDATQLTKVKGVRQVRVTCQSFMVELVEQIRMRFSALKSKMFDDLKFLYPSNAVNCHPASLLVVYESFKFLEDIAPLQLVDIEWRKQGLKEDSKLNRNHTDLEFWKERLSIRTTVES